MSDLERIEEKLDMLITGTVPVRSKRLLSVKETADYLGRNEDWVRRYLQKKVTPVRDGELRFDIKDLDKYIEESKR